VNKLFVGNQNHEIIETELQQFRKSGFLYIADEVPEDFPKARYFDLTLHSFNPLKNITEKKARELADVLYAISPGGENTLTVRNGRIALQNALRASYHLDKLQSEDEEVQRLISDVLFNPIVKRVLCDHKHLFSFNPNSVVLVRLNRAELGEKDALILGLFLIGQWTGQLIIPDGDFYLRDGHASLVRDDCLITGLPALEDVPPKLQRTLLKVKDKTASGVLYEDAVVLASYMCPFRPGTDGHSSFIEGVMRGA
jgi:hypothetical protein